MLVRLRQNARKHYPRCDHSRSSGGPLRILGHALVTGENSIILFLVPHGFASAVVRVPLVVMVKLGDDLPGLGGRIGKIYQFEILVRDNAFVG